MPLTPSPAESLDHHDPETWPGGEHTRIYSTEDAPTMPDHIFDNLLTTEWTPNKPPTKG